jgi:hypothetical protein
MHACLLLFVVHHICVVYCSTIKKIEDIYIQENSTFNCKNDLLRAKKIEREKSMLIRKKINI